MNVCVWAWIRSVRCFCVVCARGAWLASCRRRSDAGGWGGLREQFSRATPGSTLFGRQMHVVKQRKGIKRVHFGQGRFVYLVLAAVDWNKREKICPGDSFEGPGQGAWEKEPGRGACHFHPNLTYQDEQPVFNSFVKE
jgi:hypothetical protein